MNEKPYDDGGPAFPAVVLDPEKHPYSYVVPGMPWLDYVAVAAMKQMIVGPGAQTVADRDENYDETNWKEVVASNAYDFAEAMLAEKRKREKQK